MPFSGTAGGLPLSPAVPIYKPDRAGSHVVSSNISGPDLVVTLQEWGCHYKWR